MRICKASIIIPNWNGKRLIKECLASLSRQVYKDFEIIVVDNGSTDGSGNFVTRFYPNVCLKSLDKNVGFAAAINIGVEQSQAKYVVFLNNDTVVDEKWLKSLVDIADKLPNKVASVGSKLLNYYNRNIIDGVGIEINEVGQAKSIGWGEYDLGQFEKNKYVFGVSGGASLFRRKIFKKVGMFDKRYFMYSEEVDWAFRAQFLGYRALFCASAIVLHKHKMTSKRLPGHLEYWQYRNMFQTIIKDMPFGVILREGRLVKIILVYINTFFYQLRNGYIWPPILAQVWLVWNLPRLIVERRKIQRMKTTGDECIEKFLTRKHITFWGLTK